MKKRKWIRPVCVAGGIIAVCILVLVIVLGYMLSKGYGMSIGTLHFAKDRSIYLIEEGDSAIVLSDQSKNKKVFEELDNGDKVLVIHDGVEETYPARTGAYCIFRLSKGDIDYRPDNEVLGIFIDGADKTIRTNTVAYTKGYGNMSLELPKTWEYAIVDNDDRSWEYYGEEMDEAAFYIDIWPKAHPEGKLSFRYLRNRFGVCGTGLEQKEISFFDYKAIQGTYDNHKYWSYIKILDVPGDYVILNEAEEAWWNQYGAEVMQILDTWKVAEGILSEKEAIEIAKAKGSEYVEYDEVEARFDMEKGTWTVSFFKKNTAGGDQNIEISAHGNILSMSWGE